MSERDEQVLTAIGMASEEVDNLVSAVENGDYSAFDFSRAQTGRPLEKERMRTISTPVPESRIEAMNRAAKKQGITRSEFVRRAIDRELLATS